MPTRTRAAPEMADHCTGYLPVHALHRTTYLALVEEVPFLVLAQQRWKVTEARRLFNNAAHWPTWRPFRLGLRQLLREERA